jgi:formyl-CoA transferase
VTLPLEGVRVLEPAVLFAAPFASTLMADFGAEVIKVELPGVGDPLRATGAIHAGTSVWWRSAARNKKSLTLDLRKEQGQELFRRLAATADVVIENFRPGVMDGWNIGWKRLHEVNPGLIMVSQTGFGQTGPYSARPAYGMIVESYGGLADTLGYSDTPPVLSVLGDHITGLVICHAIMFALYHRDVHGGPGQHLDNAAVEAILRVVGDSRVPLAGLGLADDPKAPSAEPFMTILSDLRASGVFQCGDGKWCMLHSGTRGTRIWQNLVGLLGREDFLDETPYPPGSPERARRRTEILDAVKAWFASMPRREVVRIAEENAITIAPIYSVAEAMDDPHLISREMFVDVDDPDVNPLRVVAPVPRFSETPGSVRHGGPRIGQHTDELLEEIGITPEELRRLRDGSVV